MRLLLAEDEKALSKALVAILERTRPGGRHGISVLCIVIRSDSRWNDDAV